jgi:hypothetical protein
MYVADPREAFFLGHRLTVVVAHLVEPRVVNLPTLLLTILFNHVVEDLLKIRVNGQICTLNKILDGKKKKRSETKRLLSYLLASNGFSWFISSDVMRVRKCACKILNEDMPP